MSSSSIVVATSLTEEDCSEMLFFCSSVFERISPAMLRIWVEASWTCLMTSTRFIRFFFSSVTSRRISRKPTLPFSADSSTAPLACATRLSCRRLITSRSAPWKVPVRRARE